MRKDSPKIIGKRLVVSPRESLNPLASMIVVAIDIVATLSVTV